MKLRMGRWTMAAGWLLGFFILRLGAKSEAKSEAAGPAGTKESAAVQRILPGAKVFEAPGVATAASADANDGSVERDHPRMDSATFWTVHHDVAAAAKSAKTLTAFRGVSRDRLEKTKGQFAEAEKAGLFRSDGQWLRKTPYDVPADVAANLRTLLFDAVRPWSGLKLCGGFHADVRLKWEGGGVMAETEALICFGCNEVKIYGVAGSLHADLAPEKARLLQDSLAPLLEAFDFKPAMELPPTRTPGL